MNLESIKRDCFFCHERIFQLYEDYPYCSFNDKKVKENSNDICICENCKSYITTKKVSMFVKENIDDVKQKTRDLSFQEKFNYILNILKRSEDNKAEQYLKDLFS